jgi:hypothetical protein
MASPSGRRHRLRKAVVLAAVVAVGVAAGPAYRSFCPVPIKQILDQPNVCDATIITVSGTVERSISTPGVGGMQINNGTGSFWVAKRGTVPKEGTKVSVRGRVNTMLPIGDLSAVGRQAE